MSYGKLSFETRGQAAADEDVKYDDASEIALNTWMIDRLKQLHPEVEPNVRATVTTIVGTGFSDQELGALTDRALRAAKVTDVGELAGIQAGVPVNIDARQGRVIDRIVGALGDDDLGRRAKGAYGKAKADGKICVH